MFKSYHALLGVFMSFYLFSCTSNSANVIIQGGDYPEGAEVVQFTEIGRPSDSVKLIAEMDLLEWSKSGGTVYMEEIGDLLYFADRNSVHVFDKETLSHKTFIGGPERGQFSRIFGLFVTNDNNLLVGDAQAPHLLKSFNPNGDFLTSYPNNDPPAWFIATDINGSFISDSLAYVTNMFADKGTKIIKYDLRGGEANKIDNIVPVADLHAELDSAMSSKVITNMSVLKSRVADSIFYVLPTNKYLINSYSMNGEKLKSIDIRGIPQINRVYSILQKLPFNSYFKSATIDDQDNIYFHIDKLVGIEVEDTEDVMDSKIANMEPKVLLVSVNLWDKTYRTFQMETRSVAPLKIIDDKLWCLDLIRSKLLLYQFPDK
ncbi:MAG TPA: hypothetical protein VKZ95_09185 [Sphingobacteriaceae bacterium]|nr:hypothetical protein [Sphingobacteriaceae bacterium]